MEKCKRSCPLFIVLVVSLFAFASCSKKTSSSSGGKKNTSAFNYIPVRSDTVNVQKWTPEYIKHVQFYLSKAFDLTGAYKTGSRMVGPEGEVIYKDSLVRPLIHFPAKCKCIVVDVNSTNKWLVDCDEKKEGNIPQIVFQATSSGLYYLATKQDGTIPYDGVNYTPSNTDVFLTIKVINEKSLIKMEETATGRSVNGK